MCVKSFGAFEVLLFGEAQADLVTVASGVLAVLGDSSAEAEDAAAVHAEVTAGTVV